LTIVGLCLLGLIAAGVWTLVAVTESRNRELPPNITPATEKEER
jgi:hypothetical protein